MPCFLASFPKHTILAMVAVVQPRFFSHFREVQQYFSELGLPKGMLEILPGITQARVVAQGGLCLQFTGQSRPCFVASYSKAYDLGNLWFDASVIAVVNKTMCGVFSRGSFLTSERCSNISLNLVCPRACWRYCLVSLRHELLRKVDCVPQPSDGMWERVSRMMSCTAEARVEGRRHSHHPSHHQQGDGRVRVQVESVLGRFTLPSTTFHRHPHCTCVTQRAPYTGTSTYARKSWGGLPRCDLAPQSTSFGTVGCGSASTVLAMTATCPEGDGVGCSRRNWNHGTHFLWDPRAAPTFHPPSTLRHRTQCSTCHLPRPHSIHYSWVASDTMSLQWL